jgi:phage N-6-adenine-methyltransferase
MDKIGYIPPSASEEWGTPQRLFDELHREFNFNLDAAASVDNCKLPVFYTKEQDALKQEWNGNVYLNPPYGRQVYDWVRKARAEIDSGRAKVVVMLLKATTEVKWFHQFIWDKAAHKPYPGVEVRFVAGRLKFQVPGMDNTAPFSSMVVVLKCLP